MTVAPGVCLAAARGYLCPARFRELLLQQGTRRKIALRSLSTKMLPKPEGFGTPLGCQKGKEMRVGRKRVARYPEAFRKMAVERLKKCDNVVALSNELKVPRRTLYNFRDQVAAEPIRKHVQPVKQRQEVTESATERELRRKMDQLKRLLADKTLEADFFKGVG